jgi:2-keto-4-pentenoate hydratase/2-oxohepta-3-ene-1,7-dioic acid hydratase in catechol pathway
MRLARFVNAAGSGIHVSRGGGWVPVPGAGTASHLTDLLDGPGRERLEELAAGAPDAAPGEDRLSDALSISDQGDIWGAGLNYRGHSEDLNTEQPRSGPGSYLRPRNCLIGNGGEIVLPPQVSTVTAEAELGLVIGRTCKDVPREDWQSVIVGVTAVLDMTAEDVIRENPRYIPWAKGFDTFCSIGPQLVTSDEFAADGLESLRVSTVRNGEVIATAQVRDMKYDLGFLVQYFTAGRTLTPGTVICTGTPGAAPLRPGDTVQAVVEGVGTLSHIVKG